MNRIIVVLGLVTALLVFVSSNPACAQSPQVPLDYWAYPAAQTLLKSGVLPNYGHTVDWPTGTMTRLEFAVITARALDWIPASPAEQRRRYNAQVVFVLNRLLNEFEPELQVLLGSSGAQSYMPKVRSLLASLAWNVGTPPARSVSEPFRDVPANHWAYEAVEKLRKAGILIGYSDNTFRSRQSR